MTGPYGAGHEVYLDAGWPGVLPLPPKAKSFPPKGFTGSDGAYPTADQVRHWAANGHAAGNICLRVPDGVVGIDIDQYDDKAGFDELQALVARERAAGRELPALAETCRSTSRSAPSGIYWFRVPAGTILDGAPLPGVEIVQRHHRYAVVWPSLHPNGMQYQWIMPGGELADRPPTPDELPLLPPEWVALLSRRRAPDRPAQNAPAGEHREATWSPKVHSALAGAVAALNGGGARHDAAMKGSCALARLELLGRAGATSALDDLGTRFVGAVSAAGTGQRTPADAAREWRDLLNSARARVESTESTAAAESDAFMDAFAGNPAGGHGGAEGGEAASAADLLPDGLEPWTGADEEPAWPTLDPAALHGLAGECVGLLDPHTEADPVAVLASLLVGFGAAVGAGPHYVADGAQHPGRLDVVLVGATAKGRKGTSWVQARRLLSIADPGFIGTRVLSGFGSGEAVVDEVADPAEAEPGKPPPPDKDRRLLVYEGEYARLLRTASREGSTLSPLLRAAWDGDALAVRSRARTSVATGAHVCVLAHITVEELRRTLDDVELLNGFANRFLFVAVRRSKRLPHGGDSDPVAVAALGRRLRLAAEQARKVKRIGWADQAARDRWTQLYEIMADDEPGGMLGAATARDAPQVLRVSLLYALLDGAAAIAVEHLNAGWAFWRYARATAAMCFGDRIGNRVVDRVLAALRDAGPDGLDRKALHGVLGRNVTAAKLDGAVAELVQHGLAVSVEVPTGGRPRVVTLAVQPKRTP